MACYFEHCLNPPVCFLVNGVYTDESLCIYRLYLRSFVYIYLSFIDPERGGFGKILPSAMIFPEGACPEGNIITKGNILPNPQSGGSINYILYRKKAPEKIERTTWWLNYFINTACNRKRNVQGYLRLIYIYIYIYIYI